MPGQRVKPRFTGGFGGFLPPPDLPPLGDYEAPTTPAPSLTVYPGGGRQSSTYNTPRSPDNPSRGAGYESVSRTPFADNSYNPRPYSPGREFNDPSLPTDSSQPDPVSITTPEPGPTVDISGTGGGLPSPYWNQPGGGYAQPGRNIAGFGGNMTLGQFLNTPLALMRFGTDRYQPGNTPNIQSGADEIPIGATSPTGPTGSQMWTGTEWVDAQPSNTDVVPSPDRTDPAFIDSGRDTGSSSSTPPTTGGGRGPTPVTGSSPMEARFAPNSGTGNYVADQTAKAFLGWNPADSIVNDTGTTGDAGHTIFYPNAGTPMGKFDPEEGWVMQSDKKFQGGRPDPRWVFPSQSESARGGFSFVGAGTQAYNDWLKEHNQWYYGKG